MHNLYPVEVLSLVLRAKGMGFYSFIQGVAGLVQSYGISVGFEALGNNGYRICKCDPPGIRWSLWLMTIQGACILRTMLSSL